jgi:hypothetical protein
MGNAIQVEDLVQANAQGGKERRVNLFKRASRQAGQEMVQSCKMSECPIGQLGGEPEISFVPETVSEAQKLLAGPGAWLVETV